jgi:hypothetical protein
MLLRELTNEALFAWKRDEAIAHCPRCKSTNVKASLYRVRDIPSLLVGFRPIRCVCCHHRFRLWRLLGEEILPADPGSEMVLVRNMTPIPVGRTEAAQRASALAAQAAMFAPQQTAGELAESLLNLLNATGKHGPGIFTNRPLFRHRIVEADFSTSLASAAMAVAQDGPPVGQPVNKPSGYRPPTGLENRRKGDRPPMHMASRPLSPPSIRTAPPLRRAVEAPATQDEFATVRR